MNFRVISQNTSKKFEDEIDTIIKEGWFIKWDTFRLSASVTAGIIYCVIAEKE